MKSIRKLFQEIDKAEEDAMSHVVEYQLAKIHGDEKNEAGRYLYIITAAIFSIMRTVECIEFALMVVLGAVIVLLFF